MLGFPSGGSGNKASARVNKVISRLRLRPCSGHSESEAYCESCSDFVATLKIRGRNFAAWRSVNFSISGVSVAILALFLVPDWVGAALFFKLDGLSIVVIRTSFRSQIEVTDLGGCEVISFLLKHRENPNYRRIRHEWRHEENNSQIVAVSYRVMDSQFANSMAWKRSDPRPIKVQQLSSRIAGVYRPATVIAT